MNDWLKKVEEMKKMRGSAVPDNPPATTPQQSLSSSSTPTPTVSTSSTSSTVSGSNTAASNPNTNRFLAKVQSSTSLTKDPSKSGTMTLTSTPSNTTSTVAPSTSQSPTQSRVAQSPSMNTTSPSSPSVQQSTTGTNNASTSTSNAPKANPFLANKTLSTTNLATTTTSKPSPSPSPTVTATSSPTTTVNKPSTPSAVSDPGAGIWKVKYEQEVKRRQELEARLKTIEAGLASNPSGSSSLLAQQKKEARKTKRMTKKIVEKERMSVHVMSTVDTVLSQIGGLDKRIRAAEAAKIQAEDKLLEIAIAKLEVDEVVQKVDTVLKKMIEQVDKFSPAQIKEMLIKVRTQTASEEEGGGSKAAMRFSIMMPKGGFQLEEADVAPPPPMAPGVRAPVTKELVQSKPSSLLDQIRAGHTLRNINVDKLKEEQKQLRANAKQTMNSLRSLEDTLRDALTNRFNDMNVGEDEDEEDDDEW